MLENQFNKKSITSQYVWLKVFLMISQLKKLRNLWLLIVVYTFGGWPILRNTRPNHEKGFLKIIIGF